VQETVHRTLRLSLRCFKRNRLRRCRSARVRLL